MKNLKKLDVVIIGVLAVISILSLGVLKLPGKEKYNEKYAVIHVNNKLYKTIPLKENKDVEDIVINTDNGKNIIQFSNGGVRILEANCPDQICVNDGFKSKPGEILVCLPNKIVVEIKGQKNNLEPDGMSY